MTDVRGQQISPTPGTWLSRGEIRWTSFCDAVPPDDPPLAWVLLWGGRYANIYEGYVPESLKRWGYVTWDASRWTDMGAKGLVAMQWETALKLVEQIEFDYNWSPVEH